jgi:hypothetical protein
MRILHHVATLLLALLISSPSLAVGEGPWECLWGTGCLGGGSALPPSIDSVESPAYAVVAEDCTGMGNRCYTVIATAISELETNYANSNRFIHIYPGVYTEDLDCTPAAGYTILTGRGTLGKEELLSSKDDDTADSWGYPTIKGKGSTAATATITVDNCIVDALRVEPGSDSDDTAIRTAAANIGNFGTHIVNSIITMPYLESMNEGQHLIEIVSTGGTLRITNTDIMASCNFPGSNTCDADTALIYMNHASAGLTITESKIAFYVFAAEPGLALIEANASQFIQLINNMVAQRLANTITGSSAGISVFELTNDESIELLWISAMSMDAGLLNTDLDMSMFMNVKAATGVGPYANVYLMAMNGLEIFEQASTWQAVIPHYIGPCIQWAYADFDPVEAAARVVSLYDSAVDTTGANEANVDEYISNRTMVPFGLTVEVGAAPAATETWQIDLRDDAANNGLTCTISEGETTCESERANPAVANIIAPLSKLNLLVTPTNTPTATTEMKVGVCFGHIAK